MEPPPLPSSLEEEVNGCITEVELSQRVIKPKNVDLNLMLIMQLLLLVILRIIGSSKTLGVPNGEKTDLSDSRWVMNIMFVLLDMVLVLQLQIFKMIT